MRDPSVQDMDTVYAVSDGFGTVRVFRKHPAADDAVFDQVVEEAVKAIAKVEPDCQVVL